MNISVSDLALTQALELFQQEWMESLPDKEELSRISLSPAFEKKMKKLIADHKKGSGSSKLKKRVITAILVAALFASMVGTVVAFREPIVEFITKTYEKFTNVSYEIPENVNAPTTIEEVIYPSYIPEGFVKDESIEEIDLPVHDCVYVNKSNIRIEFKQRVMAGAQMGVDTEDTEVSELEVNGRKALYYERKGQRHIIWASNSYFYLIHADSRVSKDEVLKIAESVKME